MVKAEERRILHRVQGGAEKLWVGRKSVTIKEMSRREYWEARCTTKRTVTLKKENRNHWLDREIKQLRLMMKMEMC